jgi:hypothetical protein
VISHEWGNDRIVITTKEYIISHLWHRYSVTVNQEMDHPWLLITSIFTRNYWKLCFTCKEAWHSQYTKHSFNSRPKSVIKQQSITRYNIMLRFKIEMWVTWQLSCKKQELPAIRVHLGSFLMFGSVCVAHLFSIMCCVFCVMFVFVLCLGCRMFPVYLDCLFLIAPSVSSNVYIDL